MALVEGAKFGREVLISGNTISIDGKHINSLNELISLNRDSRQRYGPAADKWEEHIRCSETNTGRVVDLCITADSVKVNGTTAESVEDLKRLMRPTGTHYIERAGQSFLDLYFSRDA